MKIKRTLDKEKKLKMREKRRKFNESADKDVNELQLSNNKEHLLNLQISELFQNKSDNADISIAVNLICDKLKLILDKQPTKLQIGNLKRIFDVMDFKGEILNFIPPKIIEIIGSFVYNTNTFQIPTEVDILIQIPKECIHSKDYLNEGVLRRKCQYIQHVAGLLLGHEDFLLEVRFLFKDGGSHKKPCLLLIPAKDICLRPLRIILHFSLDQDAFRLNRFHILKNNIRRNWYANNTNNQLHLESKEVEPITPHYNTWVLSDMVMLQQHVYLNEALEGFDNVKQAVILLKIWLAKRQLNRGYSSSYFFTNLAAYMIGKHKLEPFMNVLQAFKNVLLFISKIDLKTSGITLFDENDESTPPEGRDVNRPEISDFHKCFEVVFIDASGYVNIAADMNVIIYDNIVFEAKESLKLLQSPSFEKFQHLFLDEVKFHCKFDHIIDIKETEEVRTVCSKSRKLFDKTIDYCGNHHRALLPTVIELLKKALDKRITIVGYLPNNSFECSVTQSFSNCDIFGDKLVFGMSIDKEFANATDILGPAANTAEAQDFLKFWGEVSEQYHYMGGAICETVKWPSKTFSDSRTVMMRITKHILNRHLKISKESIGFTGSQLDFLLQPSGKHHSTDLYGTGEEQHASIIKSLDVLAKQIRLLENLPLAINSVQGLSPVFRYAEVFPAPDKLIQINVKIFKTRMVPSKDKPSPPYVPSYDVVCMLESSGKWPEDELAVLNLKTAFYVKMASELEQRYQYKCLVHRKYLDVHKDKRGYVFRLHLHFLKEISNKKIKNLPDGKIVVEENEESKLLERKIVYLPTLTSMLHGIYQQNNSFSGTVRLAKRWVCSQLLSGFIPDEAVELCIAYLYTLGYKTSCPPSSPLLGFLQFLHLIAYHDWALEPLFINLNNEFSDSDYSYIASHFHNNRQTLPCMFLSTPGDKYSEMLTREQPSKVILTRLVLLAKESLVEMENVMLEECIVNKKEYKKIFRPPLTSFNVLINLDLTSCSRFYMGIDFVSSSKLIPPNNQSITRGGNINVKKIRKLNDDSKDISATGSLDAFPVVDFDPARLYLRDLKESLGEFALFFLDPLGGQYIAVAWKYAAFKPVPYQASLLKYRKLDESNLKGTEAFLIPNVDSLILEMENIGKGIVTEIKDIKK